VPGAEGKQVFAPEEVSAEVLGAKPAEDVREVYPISGGNCHPGGCAPSRLFKRLPAVRPPRRRANCRPRSAAIINDPTAAALAYGLRRRANERNLVSTVGGALRDVSCLEWAMAYS